MTSLLKPILAGLLTATIFFSCSKKSTDNPAPVYSSCLISATVDSATGALLSSITYNSQGYVTEQKNYQNNKLTSRYVFSYNGLFIDQTIFDSDDKVNTTMNIILNPDSSIHKIYFFHPSNDSYDTSYYYYTNGYLDSTITVNGTSIYSYTDGNAVSVKVVPNTQGGVATTYLGTYTTLPNKNPPTYFTQGKVSKNLIASTSETRFPGWHTGFSYVLNGYGLVIKTKETQFYSDGEVYSTRTTLTLYDCK